MTFEEIDHGNALWIQIIGAFPIHQALGAGENIGDFDTDDGWMRRVVAGHHNSRHINIADKIAADAENEVTAPHIAAKAFDCRRIELRPLGLQFLGPFNEAVLKICRVIRMHTNRILQHQGANPSRCGLMKLKTKAGPNADASHMKSVNAQMIDQRQMICGIGMPAVIRLDRATRCAGITLIHRHDAVFGSQNLRPVIPRPRAIPIEETRFAILSYWKNCSFYMSRSISNRDFIPPRRK